MYANNAYTFTYSFVIAKEPQLIYSYSQLVDWRENACKLLKTIYNYSQIIFQPIIDLASAVHRKCFGQLHPLKCWHLQDDMLYRVNELANQKLRTMFPYKDFIAIKLQNKLVIKWKSAEHLAKYQSKIYFIV